jgi:hypothetical protein
MPEENDWLLIGKEEVRAFLRNASDYKLKKWIEAGMPVVIEGGEWAAHKQNLEDFFRAYTRQKAVFPEENQTLSRKK